MKTITKELVVTIEESVNELVRSLDNKGKAVTHNPKVDKLEGLYKLFENLEKEKEVYAKNISEDLVKTFNAEKDFI